MCLAIDTSWLTKQSRNNLKQSHISAIIRMQARYCVWVSMLQNIQSSITPAISKWMSGSESACIRGLQASSCLFRCLKKMRTKFITLIVRCTGSTGRSKTVESALVTFSHITIATAALSALKYSIASRTGDFYRTAFGVDINCPVESTNKQTREYTK